MHLLTVKSSKAAPRKSWSRIFTIFLKRIRCFKEFLINNGSFLIDICFQPKIVVDWSVRCETPAGAVGQVRSHRCVAPRRLTAHPAESEHPEAEINYCCTLLYFKQQSLRTEPSQKRKDSFSAVFRLLTNTRILRCLPGSSVHEPLVLFTSSPVWRASTDKRFQSV